MPSFSTYKQLYGANNYVDTPVTTIGEAHKFYSDMVMEETWWRDIESQVAYLYDYYHDDYKTKFLNLDPVNDPKKVPIDIKYIAHTSQTYSKDIVTYHIQLRPSQECNVDYYKEYFEDRYGATFPNGLYVDIRDNKGRYNKWLIVAIANFYDSQFSTYEVLPCDYVFQWIINNKKYYMSGVLRSQNSYNKYCCFS